MGEVSLQMSYLKRRAEQLEPLVGAELAANIPPIPHTSQAAWHAAMQRYYLLSHERHLITRRLGKCSWPERGSRFVGRAPVGRAEVADARVAQAPTWPAKAALCSMPPALTEHSPAF